MAHDLDIVELCDRGLGNIFERFAGGIGYEVKVEAVHRLSCRVEKASREANFRAVDKFADQAPG